MLVLLKSIKILPLISNGESVPQYRFGL